MKKSFFAIASLIGMMSLVTACQDDSVNETSTQHAVVLNSEKDITNGYNILIYGQDTLDVCNLPLNTTSQVKVTSKNGLIDMVCGQNKNGQTCLMPVLTSPQTTTVTDEIHISSVENPSNEKDITVIVHPRNIATRSAATTVKGRLSEVFSYGIIQGFIPGDEITTQPVFMQSAIEKYVNENHAFNQGGYSFKTQSTDMEELTKQWITNSGLTFPVGTLPVMASIGVSTNSTEMQSHEREYTTVECGERKALGVLNDTLVNSVPYQSEFWASIIDGSLNNYLNNAQTGNNNIYSLDEKGALELVKTYGTHIPTQILLGSTCRLEASKTIDAMQNSFEIGIDASLSQSAASTAGIDKNTSKDDKKALADIYKSLSPKGMSATVSVKNVESRITKTSDMKTKLVYVGGGEFKGDRWYAGNDVSQWATLGYSSNNTAQAPKFIPLYALISQKLIDTNANVRARYESLMKVIDEKENDYPKYMKAFGRLPEKADKAGHYVIADFIYKLEDKKDGEPFTGNLVTKDGQTVEVIYYPMAWNENNRKLKSAYDSWSYKTFDTLMNCFVSLGRSSKYGHFYYALLPESECYGIDAITFVPEESCEGCFPSWFPGIGSDKINRGEDYKRAGWTRRTERAHCGEGVSGDNCDKVVPYVHYRNAKSKSMPISALCLFNEDKIIMSSTAGTEYNHLDQASTTRYDQYWIDCNLTCGETDDIEVYYNRWYKYENTSNNKLNQKKYYKTNSACAYSWFRASAMVAQHNMIYVGYSFRPVDMVVKVNNAKEPLKALLPEKYQ